VWQCNIRTFDHQRSLSLLHREAFGRIAPLNCSQHRLRRTGRVVRATGAMRGHESVALVGLQVGYQRFGLLQLNDHRTDRFSREPLAIWERLADYLAVALAEVEVEEDLRQSEWRNRSLFDNMLNGFAYRRRDPATLDQSSALLPRASQPARSETRPLGN